MNNRYRGIEGENLACQYMQSRGMTILCRNYAVPQGEIDVVAKDGEYLVFCEVKSRKNGMMGYGVEAVTPQKITQIVTVAEMYLKKYRQNDANVRFDVASVDLTTQEVEYIDNAFSANDAGRRNHW